MRVFRAASVARIALACDSLRIGIFAASCIEKATETRRTRDSSVGLACSARTSAQGVSRAIIANTPRAIIRIIISILTRAHRSAYAITASRADSAVQSRYIHVCEIGGFNARIHAPAHTLVFKPSREFRRGNARATTKDQRIRAREAADPIGAMHAARAFAGCEQARHAARAMLVNRDAASRRSPKRRIPARARRKTCARILAIHRPRRT